MQELLAKPADLSMLSMEELEVVEKVLDYTLAREATAPTGKRPLVANPSGISAGDMVVYAASSLHRVEPVTRGVRCAAFFWVQSMVRDDGARHLLFELDMAIRDLTQHAAQREPLLRLTSCYHNLLRRWAEL